MLNVRISPLVGLVAFFTGAAAGFAPVVLAGALTALYLPAKGLI